MARIDIHTHVVPDSFPAYTGSGQNIPWPSIHSDGCGHAQVMISGKAFRKVSDVAWDSRRRFDDMDKMGIGRQVLSPMPELLSYWLPATHAAVLLRHVNQHIAEMVAVDPSRLSGLAAVPLQDPDLAIREMEHAMRTLGLSGVEIGTNVNGVPIGDRRFAEFFSAAETFGAAIFVHGLRPDVTRLVGPAVLEQIVGFPCEVALAAASMITGGILARHPGLRMAFSHGGGAFALVLARMEHTWHKVTQMKETLAEPPSAYARRLYYDTAVFRPEALRFLVDTFGEDRMLIGTDYPFGSYETAPLDLLSRAGLRDRALSAIGTDNAKRFLALQ